MEIESSSFRDPSGYVFTASLLRGVFCIEGLILAI